MIENIEKLENFKNEYESFYEYTSTRGEVNVKILYVICNVKSQK